MIDSEEPQNRSLRLDLGAATGSAVTWRALQLVGTRVIALGKFLVLARILAPQDFGLLAIAAVAVELLLSLTDFGMIPALVQRDHLEQRHYDTAWTLNLLRSLVIAAAIIATAPALAHLFGEPRATHILQVLALRPVLDAIASIKVADLTKRLRFRSLAAVRLTAAVVDATVAIALASTLGVWAVVIAALAGAFVSSIASYLVAPYRPHLSLEAGAATSLFRFGRWMLLAGVLGVAGDAVLRGVISRRLGAFDLGVYYVAVRIAILPYEVISEVVVAVGFPVQAILQKDRERAARVFRSILKATLAVLIPAYAIVVVLAGPFVAEFLGARWHDAVPVIRLIAVIGIIGTVYDGTTAMLQGLGRPQWVAALAAVQFPIVAGLAWWLAGSFGVTGAALARLCAEVCVQATAVVLSSRLLPRPFIGIARPLLAFGAAACVGAVCALSVYGLASNAVGVVTGAMGGVGIAYVVLAFLDRRFALGLRADAVKVFPALTAWLRLAPGPGRARRERPKANVTAGWGTYFEHLAPDTPLYREQSNLYVQALTAVVPMRGDHRVLDFGCGFGFSGAILAPLVNEVWLWDSSPHMRAVATQNTVDLLNVKICAHPPGGTGDQHGVGSEPVAFDVVLVNSVAQYMQRGELRSWLGRWKRIIRPHGLIVLSDLIPPGHGRLSDTWDLLRLGAHTGSTVSATRHALGGVFSYWRTSRRVPLLSVGKGELGRMAEDAGLRMKVLPHNLTHFSGRWAAILRSPDNA